MYKYILLFLFFSNTLFAQTCHFVVFCDTDDSRLMVPASQSYSFFADELPERVKQYTGMNITYHLYKASQFNASNFDNKLSSLSVGSNDVIFFWFDGHGYNAGDNDWPTLSLGQSNYRSLNTVFNTLNSKGARLVIVMANACNKERSSRANYVQHNYVVQNQSEKEVAEHYKDLFLRSKGATLVASSKKGETSQSGQFGAWFFLAFRENFDKAVEQSGYTTANWEQLINNTQIRTAAIADDAGYTQTPIRYVTITNENKTVPTPSTLREMTEAEKEAQLDKELQRIREDAEYNRLRSEKELQRIEEEKELQRIHIERGAYNIEMVYVQGGTFTMGCTSEQSNCESYEKPAHTVSLSSFSIGKYEVSQAQWRAVMGDNPSGNKDCDRCPVERVSWDDVQKFILKLNQKTGKKYRLPTEAEWEYAARGGSRSNGYQYSGSNNVSMVAWYRDNNGSKTHIVGSKSPNELGIYDMSGNVSEWCSDWFNTQYYNSSPSSNPKGASSGSNRVLRGGNWIFSAEFCRVAACYSNAPQNRYSSIGFRLALDL